MDDFDCLELYPGYYGEEERFNDRSDYDDDTAENAGYDPEELDDDELDTVWEYGAL